jgi:hypothetical protein
MDYDKDGERLDGEGAYELAEPSPAYGVAGGGPAVVGDWEGSVAEDWDGIPSAAPDRGDWFDWLLANDPAFKEHFYRRMDQADENIRAGKTIPHDQFWDGVADSIAWLDEAYKHPEFRDYLRRSHEKAMAESEAGLCYSSEEMDEHIRQWERDVVNGTI